MKTSTLPTTLPEDTPVYTVSALNAEARETLESRFKTVWVTGEISNLVQASSGHAYFSLKDQNAQVRCALFRQSSQGRLGFTLKNGQQILVKAKISLYEPRGDFQLIVTTVHLAGQGALQLAFEQLKKRLAETGLFDPKYKKPIPVFPRCIGVVTSPTGAAVRDILKVAKRRCPNIPFIIYPTLVQGENAAPQIVEAIQLANQRQECDVLIVARGGGSLEDLWPFNEESVAYAIFQSEIPIVSGVGHEIDFTIADFVADCRAPTPSSAAELTTPNTAAWLDEYENLLKRLTHLIKTTLKQNQMRLEHLQKQLRHPKEKLQDKAQQLDHLEKTLIQNMNRLVERKHLQLTRLQQIFMEHNPLPQLRQYQQSIIHLKTRLVQAMHHIIKQAQQQLMHRTDALNQLNPLNLLSRGYAILSDQSTNTYISHIGQVSVGDHVLARLSDGILECEIIGKREG